MPPSNPGFESTIRQRVNEILSELDTHKDLGDVRQELFVLIDLCLISLGDKLDEWQLTCLDQATTYLYACIRHDGRSDPTWVEGCIRAVDSALTPVEEREERYLPEHKGDTIPTCASLRRALWEIMDKGTPGTVTPAEQKMRAAPGQK